MGVCWHTVLDSARRVRYKKAPWLGAFRSLSDVVGGIFGRCERIRTSDPFVPKKVDFL
jgi:hypothetical protein